MRGLAAGQMRQKIAVVVFSEVDPARGAGGDHRQDAAIGQTAEKLGGRPAGWYSLDELLFTVKTKRYTMARIRRIMLSLLIGITKTDMKQLPPYGRILAFNERGKEILAKAKNVELRCYEDPDFYDKYTMAIDGAEEKICAIVKRFWGLLASIPAVGTVFYLMYDIDHYAVLFIISPLIGNFIFGNYKRKYEYKRYQAQVPGNKVHNYVSRMMYLPDGAKEMRLSNVFSLLRKQYKEATEKNVRAAVKYAFANCSLSFWRITFTFTIIFEGVLFYASYRNLVSKTITLAQLTIMTSLMVAMTWILIMAFEEEFNTEIPDDVAEKIRTVRDAVELLDKVEK